MEANKNWKPRMVERQKDIYPFFHICFYEICLGFIGDLKHIQYQALLKRNCLD